MQQVRYNVEILLGITKGEYTLRGILKGLYWEDSNKIIPYET